MDAYANEWENMHTQMFKPPLNELSGHHSMQTTNYKSHELPKRDPIYLVNQQTNRVNMFTELLNNVPSVYWLLFLSSIILLKAQ